MVASTFPSLPMEGKINETFAAPLRELIDAATKLAQLDEAVQRARANGPPASNDEAQLWHDVSVKSLLWTRTIFAEQLKGALDQLQVVAAFQMASPAPPPGIDAVTVHAKSAGNDVLPLAPIVATIPGKAMHETEQPPSLELVGSLRKDLETLKEYPPGRCLIVRRIKRLGINSPQLLRAWFEQFGFVTEVFAAHSAEKRRNNNSRVRPAAIGFIVMGSNEEANAALAAGPSVMIGEVGVDVLPFADCPEQADGDVDAVAVTP